MNLTQHYDVCRLHLATEGVRQIHTVQSCVVSAWPVDHEALLHHRVVLAGHDLTLVEVPRLVLHHSLLHAVAYGELVCSLDDKTRLDAQMYILDDFCAGRGKEEVF